MPRTLPDQCASCPFLVGNNLEFGEVVNRIRKKHGLKGKATKRQIGFARIAVYVDVKASKKFSCHGSVYDANMDVKHVSEWKPCAGALRLTNLKSNQPS